MMPDPRAWTLPPGFHLPPQRPCPKCGRWMVRASDLEGLPVYQCPERCEEARKDDQKGTLDA